MLSGCCPGGRQKPGDHTRRCREQTGQEAKPFCCIEWNSGLFSLCRSRSAVGEGCLRGAGPPAVVLTPGPHQHPWRGGPGGPQTAARRVWRPTVSFTLPWVTAPGCHRAGEVPRKDVLPGQSSKPRWQGPEPWRPSPPLCEAGHSPDVKPPLPCGSTSPSAPPSPPAPCSDSGYLSQLRAGAQPPGLGTTGHTGPLGPHQPPFPSLTLNPLYFSPTWAALSEHGSLAPLQGVRFGRAGCPALVLPARARCCSWSGTTPRLFPREGT